jgi:soluble lytic murein transglycosylase
MRGIGRTLTPLPIALVLIAGAVMLTGTTACAVESAGTDAGPNSDETAMAIPRVSLSARNQAVALPTPLNPSDAARVRRAFLLQEHGDTEAAARLADEVDNPLLTGPILAARYLGRSYHSTPGELAGWLERYPDLPDAPAVHALLVRRLPKGMLPPLAPHPPMLPQPGTLGQQPSETGTAEDEAGGTSRTASAVRTLFTGNRDADALRTAAAALRRARSDPSGGEIGFVAGLAAWRLGRIELAQIHFESAAEASGTARVKASAAFWAARAHFRRHDEAGYVGWLRRAAEQRGTFYGLIARRTLDFGAGLTGGDAAAEADAEAVAATPRGLRAFALLQVDQPARAEAELRLLWSETADNAALRRSILLVAADVGLTDLVARIAAATETEAGQRRDDVRLAVPRLRPAGGFRIDPALVYALTRLESNFDAAAKSPVGAVGLMQVMPVTARYVTGNDSLRDATLHNPSLNLDVGQRYIAYLGQQDGIDGDLIRVLASYNAGPGGFLRWNGAVRDEDAPLLFIEAIPNDETRGFVRHVLTYTWIYAARLGLPAPSLDEIAVGEFPRFTPLAHERRLEAAAPRVH